MQETDAVSEALLHTACAGSACAYGASEPAYRISLLYCPCDKMISRGSVIGKTFEIFFIPKANTFNTGLKVFALGIKWF